MHTLIKLQPLAERQTAPRSADVARAGCLSCSANKVCLPGLLNDAETRQFEKLVAGRRRVARHASLFREDDRLEMLYAVRFGQFKLVSSDATGGQRVAQFYLPGSLVGFDAIATGRHNFRLIALENSEVCEIPFAGIAALMAAEPAFQQHFLQSMSRALNEEHGRSSLLSLASLDERFASFLLQLGQRFSRLGYSDKSFRLSMTRGDIGSYLGTTVESVSRLIARFNAHGVVSITGRTVELLDRDYLLAILSNEEHGFVAARNEQHA
jgi:CRP/FNR family transcriptional regulator